MKIGEILYEQPQMIGPTEFNLTDRNNNLNVKNHLMRKKSSVYKLEDFDDSGKMPLFRKGNTIFAIDNDSDLICYIVKFEVKSLSVTSDFAVTQRAVWVDRTNPLSDQLPSYIFWNYLFKDYSIISSDNEQTEHGQRFWIKRVNEAFRKNLFVYVSYTTNPRALTRIHDNVEFKQLIDENKVWGNDKLSQFKRLIISVKPLIPKNGVIDNT